MGHERVGLLPKTKRWREIVASIGEFEAAHTVADIADSTLAATSSRFQALASEESVTSAVSAFVALARGAAAQSEDEIAAKPLLSVIRDLVNRIDNTTGSMEAAELVKRAISEAAITWHQSAVKQTELFPGAGPWSQLGTPEGFCEVSRLFFGKLTEKYLCYFLDREASGVISSVGARGEFHSKLQSHVDEISRHSFETAKITQSFAAGWFAKHALAAQPSERQIRKFVAYALQKIRSDIGRSSK
jgi:hypothetical protein